MFREKFWNKPTKQEIRKHIENEIQEKEDFQKQNFSRKLEKKKYGFTLKNTRDMSGDVSVGDLYSWYHEAMLRRDREPLSIESFEYHFFESEGYDPTFAFGNKEKGYLLGFKKFGIFIPSHFAPKTIRGGYELIKALGESKEVPAVMAITEDLGETLNKMPSWKKLELNKKIKTYFRGEIVEKEIYFNSFENIQFLMQGLLLEFMEESQNIYFNSDYENGDEESEEDFNEDDNLFEETSI